jgi:REG-2-like HAD superfamily hydrolase
MSSTPQAPIRGVLFDAHGVLIRMREDVGRLYSRCAAEFGIALPAWRLEDAFHRVLRHAPARVFPGESEAAAALLEQAWWKERVRQTFQATDSTVRFPDFEAFFRGVYAAFETPRAWVCDPDLSAVLAALRTRGLRLGVASNFDHRLPDLLQLLDLEHFFESVTIPSRVGHAKPESAFFHAACSALGLAASEIVYVGEAGEHDLGAAEGAGLRVRDARHDGGLASLPAWLDALAKLD